MNEDTAKLISIPIAACLSTFCLWLLCLASPPKLEGHWHVYDADGTRPNSNGYIQTIDLGPDREATINLGIGGNLRLEGQIISTQRRIEFGAECLSANFKYYLKGDTLFLRQPSLYTEDIPFYAIRCQEGCCNKQSDFFLGDSVDIDLPVVKHQHTLDTLKLSSRWMHIKVGIPKQEYQIEYGSEPRILLDNYFYDTLDLELDLNLWTEIHLIKLPEHQHAQASPLLFVDRHVRMEELSDFLQKLADLGFKESYFVLRSLETDENFKLWINPIDIPSFTHFPNKYFTIERYLLSSR